MNGIEAFSQEANGKDHGPPYKNGQKNDENGVSQPTPPITYIPPEIRVEFSPLLIRETNG